MFARIERLDFRAGSRAAAAVVGTLEIPVLEAASVVPAFDGETPCDKAIPIGLDGISGRGNSSGRDGGDDGWLVLVLSFPIVHIAMVEIPVNFIVIKQMMWRCVE